jgi:subtilisin family serine protease
MGWSDAFAEGGRRTARVGILDTGLTPRTDLWRQVVASHNVLEPGAPAFDQPNGIDENANGIADEGAGHGSMVAGVVNLVAPRAELVIVKVADDEGESTSWRIMRGVLHAVMEGCQVINISLGTDVPLNALECIVEFAMERGVLIVAPSGNDGLEVVLNPSRIRGVLSVAGLEKDDRKADFSNYGERIDVSAPADGISSLWHDGTVASYSGTSFSSPLAAGAAAIAIQHLEQVPDAWNLASLIRSAGRSINNQNPGYEGKLGTALSVSRLASYGYSGPDGTCLVLDAPEAVAGGSTFWVTLTLNQPAPKDIWLNVSASEASVLTPQWVLIPVGAKTATFDVCTTAVSRPLEATLCVWNETLYAAKVMMIRPPSGTP